MTSRNQREGRYGGKASSFEVIKDLANGHCVWKRGYVRHAHYKNAGLKLNRDNCEICHGAKGGTRGNENRINGKVVCDYCHADGSYND